MTDERKSWQEYFLDLAKMVATRATCPRASHGCVLVKNHRVIATGYNGSPPGEPHCTDAGCRMRDCQHWVCLDHDAKGTDPQSRDPRDHNVCTINPRLHPGGHCIRTIHAEQNALINALVPVYGATAYVTGTPCPDCMAALYQAGITDIRWRHEYPPKEPTV